VERLAAFSRDVARGHWDEPLDVQSIRELDALVEALETMRRDLAEYRRKLITSERQAAWSQMARRVAHEIKNPLTPIAVSIEDLHRSYEQRREDFPDILRQAVHTIAEEVATMKRLLQEFSDFARFPAPSIGPCRVRELLDDVAALYGREIAAGRLTVAPLPGDLVIDADAGQIRQVLVNLVKNALEALDGSAGTGTVAVAAETSGTDLVVTVRDTGPGLSEAERANLFLPGLTTKSEGSGLGLTIVERIVNDHDGTIAVESRAGSGTTIRVRLPQRARRSP
jgi:nitrogen fixation/metabolism regulation signal transduction histidine kinase